MLRFMIDCEITGSDWITLPAGMYTTSPTAVSRCTHEFNISFHHIITHATTGIYSAIAPLRILSFDIECMGRKGHFPDADYDPVIQIANIVSIQGVEQPIIRNVFTLNTSLPIVGAQVICSSNEADLLLKWREFVNAVDPDIITGYNIANFDIPYLLNRAKVFLLRMPMT